MKVHRSIAEPLRQTASWEERWDAADQGLIASWETGREKRLADPALAEKAANGELVVLPWKGGVERAIKNKKFGSLFYLAMWQGLRGEDLSIDATEEVVLKCSITGMAVTFTNDREKYADV